VFHKPIHGDNKMNIETFIGNAVANTTHTLVRTAGSYIEGVAETEEDAKAFILSQDWTLLTKEDCDKIDPALYHPQGICSYFNATIEDNLVAWQGVDLKGNIPDSDIKWVKGAHQDELQAPSVVPKRTKQLCLIIGKHEEKMIVFTWFPGIWTPFIPVSPGTPIKDVPDNATVKLAW
jgi:hypothetical protein